MMHSASQKDNKKIMDTSMNWSYITHFQKLTFLYSNTAVPFVNLF